MRSLTKLVWTAVLGGLLLASQGCVMVPGGEPPRSPAAGYRYHYGRDNVDLLWNASLGVYTVLNLPSIYFFDGHYYRNSGGWEWATGPRGPWLPHGDRGVPPGLAKKYERHERGRSNGRGHDRGRGHDHDRGRGHDRGYDRD